jgi:adenine-specific DNA methylase
MEDAASPRQCPRMLDLFSGTGSVGRVFRDHGYEVTGRAL